jgi:hypothetical protein
MGKRGPQKGAKYRPTLDKAQAREALRVIVLQHMERMTRAQIAASCGIGHVYTRDKYGKFTRIEDAAQADKLLTEGVQDRDFWIFMKDPSTAAFADLMNRALDKPVESTTVEHTGGIDIGWKGAWPEPKSS